ncbi:MAG: NUDIX domain-containing protein [Pseudonocardiaceae bacterium]
MRERGETARQAAARELTEETGIWTTDLDFAAVDEFDLRQPARREYAWSTGPSYSSGRGWS